MKLIVKIFLLYWLSMYLHPIVQLMPCKDMDTHCSSNEDKHDHQNDQNPCDACHSCSSCSICQSNLGNQAILFEFILNQNIQIIPKISFQEQYFYPKVCLSIWQPPKIG